MARVMTSRMGGVGITQTVCDNCGKPCPLVWRGKLAGEFCSFKCQQEFEAKENNTMTEATAVQTATETSKKASRKAAAKGKAKATAKKAAKGKAATKKASKGSVDVSKSLLAAREAVKNKDAKIKTLGTGEFRGSRAKGFKALRRGMTVGAALEALQKATGSPQRNFFTDLVEKGVVALA